MNNTLELFLTAWVLTQAASMVMLWAGTRFADRGFISALGEKAHRQKIQALERLWPLTRIRPAIARTDTRTCSTILTSLIVVKSAASLAFGIVMVFWLPLACLVLPAIIAEHDGENPHLGAWVKRVAALQLTSHALAAALGFALTAPGLLSGSSLATTIGSSSALVLIVIGASLAFALAAGKAEASGVMKFGI